MKNYSLAGFWRRSFSTIIDMTIMFFLFGSAMSMIYGQAYWDNLAASGNIYGIWDLLINYIVPPIATILFWAYKKATPGKMALGAIIVDRKTGQAATLKQLIIRYLGYFISFIPLGLGFLWIAFDQNKQGWHDKLAGTIVIYRKQQTITLPNIEQEPL